MARAPWSSVVVRAAAEPRGSAGRMRGTALAALLALVPAAAAAQSWTEDWDLDAPAPAVARGAAPAPASRSAVAHASRRADFQRETPSTEARLVADWALRTADNGGLPYLIVDKANARVIVFDARGRMTGAGPALLGVTRGDRTSSGIGSKALSEIGVEDRVTPAGRFVASIDRDLQGQTILWIDYASALALHRVVKGRPEERRAERLQSETPHDNRVSYGCINVESTFFETVVSPAFAGTTGIVYILPETGTAAELFGARDVGPDATPAGTVPGR